MYKQGHSIEQISKELKVSRNKIHSTLKQGGVDRRPNNQSPQVKQLGTSKIARSGSAPYGFTYHLNRLVVSPQEVATFLKIIDSWDAGLSAGAIAKELNGKNIKTRHGYSWQHNSAKQIIERHKQSTKLYEEAKQWVSKN